ncbi:MAG: DUF4212 domain-containing protein [Chloroflexaceae bacterium]|nr:DUF4212 domain-containing protein [Chloroflexaceae bacterium]NJL32653.1 DUF4212 domain-containing protein [Chloroflexaceae bacterium]
MAEPVGGAQGTAPAAKTTAELTAREKAEMYWRKNVQLITILLSVWFLVSYVFGILLAVPLQNIRIGVLPLGFWFAQQGSLVTFCILILIYAVMMDRYDKEFDVAE